MIPFFKVTYEQLVPRSVVVERAKKAELFCGAVPVAPVVCVSETQTLNCFYTAKVQDKTLLFTFLFLLSEPIVCIVLDGWIARSISRPMVCAEGKKVACQENLAPRAAACFRSPWA